MDSPAPAQDIVGAMEETEDPVSKVSSLGTRGTACAQGHRDRAWCLVECGSLTHAFGREQSFTHGVGSPQPSYSTPGPAAEHLNRRIRTRTYGGVGGRERQLSLRPDEALLSRRDPQQAKEAERLGPKGKWRGRGVAMSPLADVVPPAERRSLTPSGNGTRVERGKPHCFHKEVGGRP